jgi:hypothetical protein
MKKDVSIDRDDYHLLFLPKILFSFSIRLKGALILPIRITLPAFKKFDNKLLQLYQKKSFYVLPIYFYCLRSWSKACVL